MEPRLQQLQEQMIIEVERATFWMAVLGALSTVVFFWMLYWVIRWGVRDGMRDADAPKRHRSAPKQITRDRDRIEGPDLRTD